MYEACLGGNKKEARIRREVLLWFTGAAIAAVEKRKTAVGHARSIGRMAWCKCQNCARCGLSGKYRHCDELLTKR